MDATANAVTTNTGRLEYISRDVSRMEQRVDTIVRALDSVYGQYVDHLKDLHGAPAPPRQPIR